MIAISAARAQVLGSRRARGGPRHAHTPGMSHATTTESHYPLNEILSVLYPDCGPCPCAECCKAQGTRPATDKAGVVALCCEPCAALASEERAFALTPDELARLACRGRRARRLAPARLSLIGVALRDAAVDKRLTLHAHRQIRRQ